MIDKVKDNCLVCGKVNQDRNDSSFECSTCKSLHEIGLDNNIRLIKSGIAFNGFNFVLGCFYTLFILGLGYFFLLDKMTLLELGFAYLALAILLMFRILFTLINHNHEVDSVLSIIDALFNRRIKNYDFGSKFFAFSWGLTGVFGVLIIVIGFLIE